MICAEGNFFFISLIFLLWEQIEYRTCVSIGCSMLLKRRRNHYFDSNRVEISKNYQRFIISGINIFLDGFVPTENLRFREESLIFKVAESASEEEVKRMNHYEYPSMTKTLGNFKLQVRKGQFTDSEILVLLGENGTGKTTFIKLLAGQLGADDGSGELFPRLTLFFCFFF